MKDMLKQIWRLYWGSYESWPEKYMPKEEKKKKGFHLSCTKSPHPHHFSNGPYLLQQDAESDDEE